MSLSTEKYSRMLKVGVPKEFTLRDDIPSQNTGLGDLLNDRVINDKDTAKEPLSQTQQPKDIKKEAIAVREAFSKAAVEQVTDDQDPVPIAIPKREADNNMTKKEFHSFVDFYYPEPEIIKEEVINLVGIANVSRPCTIREHLPARMYTFLNVLTQAECGQLMSQLDFSAPEQKIQQGLVTTAVNSNQTLIRTSIRRNFIDEDIARVVWNAINSTLPAELPDGRKLSGIRSKMNYYRYEEGQYFKIHTDGGFTFSETGDTSEYTFVIYLNDDFTGGTTRYCYLPEWNNEIREVKPIQGGMSVFRQSDMKHCGVTLAKGFKHIIQGMVMYGPLKYNHFGKPIGKNPQLFNTTQCVWIVT